MPISINDSDKSYCSWRLIAARHFMLVTLLGLSILMSTCTRDHDLKDRVLGAWRCLSEPGVVRAFYVNNSYLEFGRAEPYARKELWKQDYIGVGNFSLRNSALILDYVIHSVKGGAEDKRGDRRKTVNYLEIQDVSNQWLFLKRHRPGISKGSGSLLLCKRVLKVKFGKFISYLHQKRLERAQRVRVVEEQARLLHKVMGKKARIIRRLNNVLCNHMKVNILWIFNKLEEVLSKMSVQFTVQRIRQNGEFFDVKFEYAKPAIQHEIIKILRESGQISIERVRSSTLNGKLHSTILLRRSYKARQCLSLVSLPVSPDWIPLHKLQLKQLQSLDVNQVEKFRKNRIKSPIDRLLKSLRNIEKIFDNKSKKVGQPGLKWKKVKSSSDYYQLRYISNYQRIKHLLTVLLSDNFDGKIVDLDIINSGQLTSGNSSETSGKLVRIQVTIKALTKKAGSLVSRRQNVPVKGKASLINVIYPKKYSSEVLGINLF